MGKFFRILPLFCHFHVAKIRKTCYKTYFFVKLFGGYEKKQYLCTVFFMVLDLRLSKDWVVGMTILLFLYICMRTLSSHKTTSCTFEDTLPSKLRSYYAAHVQKNGIESQLSAVFFAHVRFLLYLCSQNGKSLRQTRFTAGPPCVA